MIDKEMFAIELIPLAVKLEKMGLHPLAGVYNYPLQGGSNFECYVVFEDSIATVNEVLKLPARSPYSYSSYIEAIDGSWAISEVNDNSSTLSLSRQYHVGVVNYILTGGKNK